MRARQVLLCSWGTAQMPKPAWSKSTDHSFSFFSSPSKVHVEVHKPPANIQWKKGTQGFSTQNETLPSHPYTTPKPHLAAALCWISHWISSCTAKPEVLFNAATCQTSFPRLFLSQFLPESRSLDGTNAVNGLMWAQQALGLLLWAELLKIMSWIVRAFGQQGERMKTLLLSCSVCNFSCWQWQLFNRNSLQWERSLARQKCWDYFPLPCNFCGFFWHQMPCVLIQKCFSFSFFPLF